MATDQTLPPEKEDLLRQFVTCFVEYPVVTKIYEDFDRLRYNHRLGGEQQCMLLTGDAGSGKSMLVKNYQQHFSKASQGGYSHNPLLFSRIPSRPTLSATILQLIRDLGQDSAARVQRRSSDIYLTDVLVQSLIKYGIELIVIDEFQELVEYKTDRKRTEIANRLKLVSEKARISIVLVGMPWAKKITEEPQWASRLMIRRQIPFFKISEERDNFVRFLMGLANRMPLLETPRLQEKHTVFALFSVCKGCLRILKYFLNEALKLALLDDAPTLQKEHLSRTFVMLHPEKTNPFKQNIDELLVSEVKEYSRYDEGATHSEDAVIPTQFTDRLPISMLLKKSR
ncbi:TniB family NTP-binding protein [Zobellella aerophila]|uniref:TniB family NTP-binding protein n=1 Tax=Zobellella aerophila TaxID=870480 RepID=A0ABP6V3X6_9GAMM